MYRGGFSRFLCSPICTAVLWLSRAIHWRALGWIIRGFTAKIDMEVHAKLFQSGQASSQVNLTQHQKREKESKEQQLIKQWEPTQINGSDNKLQQSSLNMFHWRSFQSIDLPTFCQFFLSSLPDLTTISANSWPHSFANLGRNWRKIGGRAVHYSTVQYSKVLVLNCIV